MFQAARFTWRPFQRSLADAADPGAATEIEDVAVIFCHAEVQDEAKRSKIVTKATKNIKWLAGKRGLKRVVLHSFTHLGGDTAEAALAQALLAEIGARLKRAGYEVAYTPFGWVCEWELSVHGESLAKVYKAI